MPATSTNHSLGIPFIEIFSVESTNNYAMQMAHNGFAADGLTILSSFQTAGKGQHNKSWHSKPDENILLSVIANARQMPVENIFLLSMSVALACAQSFKDHTGNTAYIKWPNDIYCNDKKAAGILVEPILRGGACQYAIIGVGMNINQETFATDLEHAISMYMVSNTKKDISSLAKLLKETIMESIHFSFAFPEKTVQLYNSLLYKKDDVALFCIDKKTAPHKVLGVNKMGQIILDNDNKTYNYGDAV